jgi:hypothetical protein
LSQNGQQWIGFRNEDTQSAPNKDSEDGLLWQNQQQAWPSLSQLDNNMSRLRKELPPRASVEEYLTFYQNSPFSEVFPVADPVLFPKTLDKAYKHGSNLSPETFTARACVFAFLACASLIGPESDQPVPPIDHEGCMTAAQLIIPDILNARVSHEAVDAVMMIVSCPFDMKIPHNPACSSEAQDEWLGAMRRSD